MIQKDLLPLACPISKLSLLPGNPRRGDVEAVKASLEKFGQRKPIVVRKSDQVVIAGNHTLQAAQALGWSEIAVVWVDDDDTMSKAFALADNRTAELGDYDEEALAALIGEVGALDPELLEATGWDSKSVSELLDRMQTESPADVDEVSEDVPAISKLGDVWLLGEHRVMCGDSTNHSEVKKLLPNQIKIQMIFTDPPYGMFYGGGRAKGSTPKGALVKAHGMIMNDDLEGKELTKLLTDSIKIGTSFLTEDGSLYVCLTWRTYSEFLAAFENAGRQIDNCIVWDKQSIGLGNSHYRPQHEFIFYSKGNWSGDKAQSDVWYSSRGSTSEYVHPTQKPVELICQAIQNSSRIKDKVLDLFGGSGSTLIAAQETNRVAYLMELDPHYVDVICARYQKHTGVLPVLESDGLAHDFSADA
jgi:DNA modification methylase